MKFLNEFIFDKQADAQKFIKNMSDLYYNKGYLSYGDVCKAYFDDDIDYNHYNIYNSHGWISFYAFEIEPYFDKFRVIFPEIIKIKNQIKENE